jgi:hypothetical protein
VASTPRAWILRRRAFSSQSKSFFSSPLPHPLVKLANVISKPQHVWTIFEKALALVTALTSALAGALVFTLEFVAAVFFAFQTIFMSALVSSVTCCSCILYMYLYMYRVIV